MSTVRRFLGRIKRRSWRMFKPIAWRVAWPVYDRIRHSKTEVYLVSAPKAGRTWLRVMMGRALCERYGLPGEQLLETFPLTRMAGIRRARWTHDGSDILFGRPPEKLSGNKRRFRKKTVVLMVRNIKDVLVSSYFQAKNRVKFAGTISEFVRDDRYGARKVLTFYAQWFANRSVPRSFHMIRYEDLHREPERVLGGVLDVLDADGIDDDALKRAVEFASFDRMKEMERGGTYRSVALGRRAGGDEGAKVRRGVMRGYVDYLSEEDIRYIDSVIEEVGDPFDSEGPGATDDTATLQENKRVTEGT